jgi:hypothetical protein
VELTLVQTAAASPRYTLRLSHTRRETADRAIFVRATNDEPAPLDEHGQILASSTNMKLHIRPKVLIAWLAVGAFAAGTTVVLGAATFDPGPVAQLDSARHADPIADSSLWLAMREVNLHIDDTHVMHVRELHGQVTAVRAGSVPFLDDPASFQIRVTSGTVDLTGPDLAALLNGYVFAYHGSPLRNIRARVDGSNVVISGIMHKGVDLPFQMTSELSLEPDGRIRAHPRKMKMLGVNGEALLHALGMHLDKVLDLRGSRGATVVGDDLLLDPARIIPPPAIQGRLAAVRVEGDHISQSFVQTPDDSVFDRRVRPDTAAHHYLYFRGGKLRFGKLLMTDTDLLIVDADQRDPFDLYMARYNVQLTAGMTKNLPNLGLRVSMPDYGKVKSER